MSSRSPGFLYMLPPIDHWDDLGWQEPPQDWRKTSAALALAEGMRAIRSSTYWEEDISVGPLVLLLPSEEETADKLHWSVGVKISNNGTSFVWSPVALPWLQEYLRSPG